MFQRLVGIMKKTLRNVLGKVLLTYEEHEKILVNVEWSMNNQYLCYQEVEE